MAAMRPTCWMARWIGASCQETDESFRGQLMGPFCLCRDTELREQLGKRSMGEPEFAAKIRPMGMPFVECICWASSLSKRDSRTSLCLRRAPLPGNGVSSPETARPKTPARYHWSPQSLETELPSPPIRGYLPAVRKCPFSRDCVVVVAARSEPVSTRKFPARRERAGNLLENRLIL